jgi:hypothetical protein
MSKRFFRFLVPMLLGVAVGFSLHDLRFFAEPEQIVPEADRGQSQRPSDVVAGQSSANFNDRINGAQHDAADFSVSDILTALGRLKDVPDVQQRTSQFGVLLRRWLEKDARGAFAYINALGEGEMKMRGMKLAVEVLAHSDPQFLAQQALAIPNSRSRAELVRGLAGVWSQTDVPSALAWAKQLSEGVEKNDALLIIRSQWASQDPEAASAQISQLPENSSTTGLISTIAARWGSSDPTKVVKWANTLPETEKTIAMSSLAGVWAQRDPLAAGNFAAQLPPGETQNEAIKSVISSWAGQNPAQTASWVLQFPTGDLQDQGIRQVVSAWSSIDPEGVQNWASNLPTGATRDFVLKSYAEDIAYWAPDKAAGIAMLIGDQTKQDESLETAIRSWSETDPASARNWLNNLNASEESKTRLYAVLPAN